MKNAKKGEMQMKATGIVRKIDELGRIVLPIELRRSFDMAVKDAVEIYTEDDKIILKKYQNTCMLCGNADMDKLTSFEGKYLCKDCIDKLKKVK